MSDTVQSEKAKNGKLSVNGFPTQFDNLQVLASHLGLLRDIENVRPEVFSTFIWLWIMLQDTGNFDAPMITICLQ